MFFLIIIFCLGLVIGSFLNVVLWRLHEGERIGWARSICPSCRITLAPRDLIPLLSFLFLKGKCRSCRTKISPSYFLVEATAGILFVLAYLNAGGEELFSDWKSIILFIRTLAFISVLIVIFIYDLRWYLILDKITLPAILVAYGVNSVFLSERFLCETTVQCIASTVWSNLILSGVIGGGFFLAQYLFSSGRWIGGGDIRLGVLMGVMVGYPNILFALFLAYVVGAVYAMYLLMSGKKKLGSALPFGTFLSAATIVTILYGTPIFSFLREYFFLYA